MYDFRFMVGKRYYHHIYISEADKVMNGCYSEKGILEEEDNEKKWNDEITVFFPLLEMLIPLYCQVHKNDAHLFLYVQGTTLL